MEMWHTGLTIVMHPVHRLVDPSDPLSLYYLMAAIIFAAAAYVLSRRGRRLVSPHRFLWFVLQRRILLHPSSVLDYKLYATNSVLFFTVMGAMVVGSGFWTELTLAGLRLMFGIGATGGTPRWWLFVLTTTVQVIALDFGYWLAHWSFHRSAVLWEFHKVHHSAAVMTPATEWRQHPVELIAFPLVFGLTAGVSYGVIVYLFGPGAQALGLFGQNVILLAHLATFHHIRHSHVWLPFTGLWGKLLHSPAHHQIHHSASEQHFGKNLGFLLSIWDWMFGTLYMPNRRERLVLGIGAEGATHDRLSRVYFQPLIKAWLVIARPNKR
jgi:sterol desaturase/sphingolipid hydroxylase (fatty acid hydroxylase superfamily)